MARSSKTHRVRTHRANTAAARAQGAGRLRIIGGEWRGRRIDVIDADGLRPTGERTRETLFNWLQVQLPGSRCLDLFAGSGALGFEALSRGAASVDFVEVQRAVAERLRANVSALGCPARAAVHCTDADAYVQQARADGVSPFQLVFLDPPFGACRHASIVRHLLEADLLHARGCLYVEAPAARGAAGVRRRAALDLAGGDVERLAEAPGLDALMREFGLEVRKCRRFGDVTAMLLAHCAPAGIGSH